MTTEALPEGMTRESLVEFLRDSGLLDELKSDLLAEMPSSRFIPDKDGMDQLEGGMGSGGFPWQYWKRLDGRIILGPEPRETLYQIYMRKGYTPLPQYGLLPTPGSRVPCCPNLTMKDHPYHVLMARGGAKEMAVQELVNAGWHLKPQVVHGKKIVFPQLKGVKIEDITCPECDKPIHGIAGTNQVMQVMRQHGRAAHDFSRRDTDEALYAIGYLREEPINLPRRRSRPAAAAPSETPAADETEDEEDDT